MHEMRSCMILTKGCSPFRTGTLNETDRELPTAFMTRVSRETHHLPIGSFASPFRKWNGYG